MHRIRGKLTYSNVVATLALFLVLAGGTALAAKQMLPKNSVGTKQIKNNAITGAKIKDGAVSGSKIVAGSLGTVPSATHATSADTATRATNADTATRATSAATADEARALGGLTAAQIQANSKLRCRTGTTAAAGFCFDSKRRTAATFLNALQICGEAGMVLPSSGEMAAFMIQTGAAEQDWTASFFFDTNFQGTDVSSDGTELSIGSLVISNTLGYRCMTTPSN
jgi:hypothetical protein